MQTNTYPPAADCIQARNINMYLLLLGQTSVFSIQSYLSLFSTDRKYQQVTIYKLNYAS